VQVPAIDLRTARRLLAPDGSLPHRALRRVVDAARRRRASRLAGAAPLVTLLLPLDGAAPPDIIATILSLQAQDDPRWELWLSAGDASVPAETPPDSRVKLAPSTPGGAADALNAALALARGTWIGVLTAGDRLTPEALGVLTGAGTRLRADVVYCDEATLQSVGPAGETWSKPDWSPELLLAFPYTGRLSLLRTALVREAGGWQADTLAAEEYELVLGVARRGGAIRRVDRTLYLRNQRHAADLYSTPAAVEARRAALARHLAAIQSKATVSPDNGPAKLRIKQPIDGRPLVSIIIPTRDRVQLLEQCVDSIVRRTDASVAYEIVVADNGSSERETLEYLQSGPVRTVSVPGPFNFSAINNAAARAARGDFLLFLNNDTEVIEPGWLAAMVEWAQQPSIGAVGAKLLFADGRFQHVGVTLHDGSAFHPGYGERPTARGWIDTDLLRNYTAVTAACMMVRKEVFDRAGGFDESFPVAYNDVELCVRLVRAGLRNLYTPYAALFHHESASRAPGVALEENQHLRNVVGDLLWSDPLCPASHRMAASTSPARTGRVSHHVRRAVRVARRTREVARAARWNRTSLRAVPETATEPSTGDLVRWLDGVEIGGETRIGLFMHPVSARTFRVPAGSGATFAASLCLLPEVWKKNEGGVVFRASATAAGRTVTREWTVNPAARPGDRRWIHVRLSFGALAGRDVDLTLSTRLPDRAGPGHAWAAWGDPLVLERKRVSDVVRRQADVVRALGVAGTLRRYARLLRSGVSGAATPFVYDAWFKQRTLMADPAAAERRLAAFEYRPRISIVTPVFNTDPKWLRLCVDSVRAQHYPDWELCLGDDGSTSPETAACLATIETLDPRIKVVRLAVNGGISAASNAALAVATGEFIALLDHDDELAPDALLEVVDLLNTYRDADLIYTDEDKLEFDGAHSDPFFKPDWSPDYLRSTMYVGHLGVHRRSLVERMGGFRSEFDGAQDYDLALRASEHTSRIHHIAKVLYHWRKIPGSAAGDRSAKPWGFDAARRALADHVARLPRAATVQDEPGRGFWRVRYDISGDPLVSIVIPTDGRTAAGPGGARDLLLECVRSIVERTTGVRYELVIVDNGRLSREALAFLAGVPHRRVIYDASGPFNFAAKVNFAARHATGEHLLLLNDDTEVRSPEWARAMLEFSQQPEVGVVGAKLFYPDGRIQHVGVVLGIGGGACHVFAGQPGDTPGYYGSAFVIRNYSAVTGACCMTRRSVFDEVGGFDELFARDFNDVDYCLRVVSKGYRIVGTPFAQLYHYEGATFGSREHIVDPAEVSALSERWGTVIDADPFYNPNLTRSALDYGLRL
jgi:GT2 family glycosyltransferase